MLTRRSKYTSLSAMSHLLNHVRDLRHTEAGTFEMKTAPFGLPSLPQVVSGVFLEETQTKSIDWALAVAPELPKQPAGVANRLREGLSNLVSEALKFISENGKVTLPTDAANARPGRSSWRNI